MVGSADMGRPKRYDFPPNMTFDTSCNRYIVRNPLTKKSKKYADEAKALKAAKAVNEWLETERQLQALEGGRPTVSGLVAKWIEDRAPIQPWAESTRKNYLAKMRRISRELGKRSIAHTDCMLIEEWIAGIAKTGDTFNDWRYVFVLLWRFAVSRKLAQSNEPEKIEERSTSKKIEANKKVRQPLDLPGFWSIHAKAEAWLQLAMEQSLVTLQGRSEICNIRVNDDYRGGHLFIIRDKTSGDSDMAFIKIAMTPQLEELRKRSRLLDQTVSPFLIHRAPERTRRQWIDGKPHWTYVNPGYLTKAFAAARDAAGVYAHLEPDARPSFHEIRGLGSRLYREQGMAENAIQALMTHANKRTTEIYLDGGAQALSDDDYQRVVAPMNLGQLK